MVTAMEEFTAYKLRFANSTVESYKASPDLPIDVFPLDLFLVIHVLDETIQIKKAICYVLSYNLPMEVDEDFGVCAHHPLILLTSVQLATVNATT